MATDEEKEQQRRRRLDELELYEKTQEKLLVWSKRHFWWVIALGGLTLGSGGYVLVNTVLSGVTDDAKTAMLKAKLAAEEITKAKDAATEAVANAKKATTQAALAATQSAAATAHADAASELAKQSEADLAEALKKFKEEGRQFASANELLRKDFEAARRRFENDVAGLASDVAGLAANAAAIRRKADPNDESLQILIDQLKDVKNTHSLSERLAAASALGQRGKGSKAAFDKLKVAFDQMVPTEYRPPRLAEFRSGGGSLVLAVVRAIAQVGGEDAFTFFLDVLADPGAPLHRRYAASKGLAAVPVWSEQGVEMLRSRFDKFDSHGRSLILGAVWGYRGPLSDQAVRATVLDLLIHALEGDDSVETMAYVIKRHFAKDGEKALPALRSALSRHKDDEIFRKAVEGAINAIEGRKED